MAAPSTPSILLSFLFISQLSTHSAKEEPHAHPTCQAVRCNRTDESRFPFSNFTSPECRVHNITWHESIAKIQFEEQGRWYMVKNISYENKMLVIQDAELNDHLHSDICNSLNDSMVLSSHSKCFQIVSPNITFLKCKRGHHSLPQDHSKELFIYTRCGAYDLYYPPKGALAPTSQQNCIVIQFPMMVLPPRFDLHWSGDNLSSLLDHGFVLQWNLHGDCCFAHLKNKSTTSLCTTATGLSHGNDRRRKRKKIIIGVSAGVGSCILTCLLFFIRHQYRKRRLATASNLLSRSISSDPSSQSELGKGGSILPTHIFTYEELEDATNNFDPSKELGDGGFGTVYHGKLRDGRSVAVKRLYENNYRRVEQFMNEIDILSRLRHQHLVTLYGCTSRRSRELLLVYEFIPNGTVADHLHGNHAKDGPLTWPIRMSIAIESAGALAYLHAIDIIHRDVKTNNILLDNNFHVKVADFGLSRLFPLDKTHVSTAPQGTPGYVDPDYHRCYQLNDKSDVYSFGVVLIELISSKPAVDITRHRHEINLANLAINKIHNHALHELVDPTIGYESDHAVRGMITLVAELAFRCLQDEKEVRPTMQEVLEVLKGIEREDYKVVKAEEVDVLAADDVVLLKKIRPLSPDSVTDAWISHSTTPNTSG